MKMWGKIFPENLEEYMKLLREGVKKEDVAQYPEWERQREIHESIWKE